MQKAIENALKYEVVVAYDWLDQHPEITRWDSESEAIDWAERTIEGGVKQRELDQGEPITEEMRSEFREQEAALVQVYEVWA